MATRPGKQTSGTQGISESPVAETSSVSRSTQESESGPRSSARTSFSRVYRTLFCVLAFAMSLLCFPSAVLWMAAGWIVWHAVLAAMNRPAWLPLVTGVAVLVLKLVPRTPAMLVLAGVMLTVAAFRWNVLRVGILVPARVQFTCLAVLVVSWGWATIEMDAIGRSSSPGNYDSTKPVVCIGDSLTQGMIPDRGYPGQLETLIQSPVINLGYSGITSNQGAGLVGRALDYDPQAVIIELGGHDFLKGHQREVTKKNLVAMIEACQAMGVDVILMEIPRGFMFDPYASLEREIAYQHDVQLISDDWLRQIVLMSPVAPPGMWMPGAQLSDDGIHSNQRGSLAIAHRVRDSLVDLYGSDVVRTDPAD
ncbi:MAG: GDSL-type esterase/lipase family protein [Planctomycetota bacterium]